MSQKILLASSKEKRCIRIVDKEMGNKLVNITSLCHHSGSLVMEHPTDPDYVLEACSSCGMIRCYKINNAESKTVYKGCKPLCICKGPDGSVFVMAQKGELLQLKWDDQRKQLELVLKTKTDETLVNGMCLIEEYNTLVLTSTKYIKALNPMSGAVLWEFSQEVERKKLNPHGLCCDMDGRVYIADGWNERLIVLKGESGELKQVLLTDKNTGWIRDVHWINPPPQLTVFHGKLQRVSNYNVTN